jgi:ubiquinone biosynthesis protein COQ4
MLFAKGNRGGGSINDREDIMELATSKPQNDPTAAASPVPQKRTMDAAEARYMQGDREPVTSSVLISNSKYLNNPYYRDAFAQQALRRFGHDLPPTYHIPAMIKAMSEVADYADFARLIAEEKVKNPDFGAWVDARRWTSYRVDDLGFYAEGTLGAAIKAFLEKGYDMEFIKAREVTSDLQYIVQRRTALHDIEHLVTGFGPNTAGEQALSICNITAFARYFTPALAQYFSEANCFVGAAGYMRTSLHYHHVMPTYLEAMQQGIAAGLALKRPLFLESCEDYLDWKLEDIAPHLGFARGPGEAWDWTTEAASG